MDFIMKWKFWIGCGLIVVVSLALYAIMVAPIARANTGKFRELQDRADNLAKFANAPELPNDEWIKRAIKEKELVAQETQKVLEMLQKNDAALFERKFINLETKKEISDEGLWREEYRKKMADLRKKLADGGIYLVNWRNAVVEDPYYPVLPTQQQMAVSTKKYWVQEETAEVLCKLNAEHGKIIPVLFSLSFASRPLRLAAPAHENRYTIIPCDLKVAMEFQDVALLVQGLLNSPMGIEIEKIEITRNPGIAVKRETTSGPRKISEVGAPGYPRTSPFFTPGYGPEPYPLEEEVGPSMVGRSYAPARGPIGGPPVEAPKERIELSETLVGVYIRFYVPDYTQPEEPAPNP